MHAAGAGLSLLLLILLGGLLVYFVPTLIAVGRKHHNTIVVFLINLIFGWTLIGWLVAFIYAFSNPSKQVVVVQSAAPGSPTRVE